MMLIHALHGFLGRPEDWNCLKPLQIHAHDLYSGVPIKPFWEWATKFNESISKDPKQSNVLLGYSLGGRLALHALIQNPTNWAAAVIISSHPGLNSADDKSKRLEEDNQWAGKFQHANWNDLLNSWNQQPVFKHDPIALKRQEAHYERSALSLCLQQWSLGKQDALWDKIASLPMPILWITGQKDEKFTSLAHNVSLAHPQSRKIAIEHAGHRVLGTHGTNIRDQIKLFLNDIGA